MTTEKLYLYPLWVRLWHWLNAIFFLTLLVTGISMQYSSPNSSFLISFEKSVQLHNICGILISINYLLFIIGNIFTTNGKFYKIQLKGLFNRLTKQIQFYLFGMFQHQNPPFPVSEKSKFNPLQKVSYVAAMYIGFPIIIISGWAMLFPELVPAVVLNTSGLLFTALFHVIFGFILSVFLIIHLYVCTFASPIVSNFKSMITGWHY
ncbi:cytochrome b/b6 domain-containing protein [Ancylomarina longa]|nr:cytochrome b/b6 domain-containing protein [Ancylomarina longa]